VGGPSVTRRLGIVYGYPILDPATGRVRTDYVGQTIQTLAARDRQHRGLAPNRDGSTRCQPWSDLIVGQPFVIEQGMWTAAELDERERHHIATLRPRYNVALNYSNGARIKPWEAQAARAQRDAARGLPPSIVPASPSRLSVWRRLAASRVVRWASRQLRAALRGVAPWLAVWAALTVAGLIWAPMPARQVPGGAAVACGVLVLLWTQRNTRKAPRRRNRRRTR
jgi:hypothetical protein